MRSCYASSSEKLLVKTSFERERGGAVAIWLRRSRRRRLGGLAKSMDLSWAPVKRGNLCKDTASINKNYVKQWLLSKHRDITSI